MRCGHFEAEPPKLGETAQFFYPWQAAQCSLAPSGLQVVPQKCHLFGLWRLFSHQPSLKTAFEYVSTIKNILLHAIFLTLFSVFGNVVTLSFITSEIFFRNMGTSLNNLFYPIRKWQFIHLGGYNNCTICHMPHPGSVWPLKAIEWYFHEAKYLYVSYPTRPRFASLSALHMYWQFSISLGCWYLQ